MSEPAWREGCAEIIELMLQRNTQYAAWFDLVEQKGLDPNRGHYPYDYYDKNMPPGWAGVYNAPGYYGNAHAYKCPRKRQGARRPTPSHTHRLSAAHTIRTRSTATVAPI